MSIGYIMFYIAVVLFLLILTILCLIDVAIFMWGCYNRNCSEYTVTDGDIMV